MMAPRAEELLVLGTGMVTTQIDVENLVCQNGLSMSMPNSKNNVTGGDFLFVFFGVYGPDIARSRVVSIRELWLRILRDPRK